ncbi:MAG TPA: peptidylprolyl isomerase [Spirochaetia bacterium]|nr:MAG: hypothetical protein A2Y41_13260 [Spirochaetes bacterium GWB1_36_13]HCL57470.1 peptidylprolyl isomerase [Spirochaetia bacterium]
MQVSLNKMVNIDYTLTDNQGEIIDSSKEHGPLSYIQGIGSIIPGLEEALEGKKKGDQFKITVPAEKGYGIRHEEMLYEVPIEEFGEIEDLEEGMEIQVQSSHGPQIMTVKKITEKTVTLDGNHPLAGMELNFDIEVQDVREATEEEIKAYTEDDHGCGCGEDHDEDDEDDEHGCGGGCCGCS